MKTIYINRSKPKRKLNLVLSLLLFFFILTVLRLVSPVLIKKMINDRGADQEGFTYHVTEVDLKILQGKIIVFDLSLYDDVTLQEYVHVDQVTLNTSLLKLLNPNEILDIEGHSVRLTISKDLFDDLNLNQWPRFKNIVADFERINLHQIKGYSNYTLLTLKDVKFELKNEASQFHLEGAFNSGGALLLDGSHQDKLSPWNVLGIMKGISFQTLEQLSDEKFPFASLEETFDANIDAQAKGEEVEGTITSSFKELTIKEEDSSNRKLSLFLEKARNRQVPVDLTIPFTLNENLQFDFTKTLENIR